MHAGQWHRQRDTELHRRRQHGDDSAHRHLEHRRPDLHGDASGCILHLHSFTGECVGGCDRRQRHAERDRRRELHLDLLDQCRLADMRAGQWHGQRDGQLFSCGQHQHQLA